MDSILRADWLDCTSILDRGNWRIILLDSVVPGRDGGLLGEGELTRLEIALQERPTQHALIALHHHPVPMAAPPMDNIGLENADRLWAIIDRHANVRGVLWGHIHNEFTGQYRECLLLGTPSTCFQFRLGAEQITIADRPPAYRRLVLASDGDIRTEVVEVPVAFQAGGCDRGGR
jgi:Icc protein